ncbi:MAG: hypothetical protein H8E26_10160 [FCB group bacterium]|nr:hypothetical protein [FCB group bacterium]MBL7029377.1 hypothetical protein [Candidatus Neomarinimicrobiota bacterium]MBL7123060.1 hypothetical protein [Candidatus Neomarinimicrobiota bacterium]
MKKAVGSIFSSLLNDVGQSIEGEKLGTPVESSLHPGLQKSGSIPFDFHLDDKGDYNFSTDKRAYGVTLSAVASIDSPDAIFTVSVKSSGGGGGHWDKVHINQPLKCEIKTKGGFSKTTISIHIHANVKNAKGHGKIDYSY